jgi:predicted MFS family arabinose efflux permease
VASALLHRLPTRAVLVGADVTRAAVALSLPFVTEPTQIYVLIFALQAASATFTPTFQAVIPAVLVDPDDYTRGLSLSRLAYDLESLASPALAAALLTVLGFGTLFYGTAAGFVASAALVISTRLPQAATTRESRSR